MRWRGDDRDADEQRAPRVRAAAGGGPTKRRGQARAGGGGPIAAGRKAAERPRAAASGGLTGGGGGQPCGAEPHDGTPDAGGQPEAGGAVGGVGGAYDGVGGTGGSCEVSAGGMALGRVGSAAGSGSSFIGTWGSSVIGHRLGEAGCNADPQIAERPCEQPASVLRLLRGFAKSRAGTGAPPDPCVRRIGSPWLWVIRSSLF
jgi:hypothetical protein